MRLFRKEISDPYIRDNFNRLMAYLKSNSLLAGFKHVEIKFDSAEDNRKVPHGLNTAPKDVIQTSLTGTGVVTWNYDRFDDTFLDVTASGPCVVRAFYGTFRED